MESAKTVQKPAWLKIRLTTNENYQALKGMMRAKRLHTVCEEAHCPNIYECWSKRKTATFMILGDTCTRACRFCAVKSGKPGSLDMQEPANIADSVFKMKLQHVVITAVARDDLPDFGADHYAKTVLAIRQKNPGCAIEVLPSDMGGHLESLKTLISSKPEVLNHNVETVRRLTDKVRSRSDYDRSLEFLRRAKELGRGVVTKSNIMIGLGESEEEVFQTMDDLRANNVDLLTIGQYLAPSKKHLRVEKYWHPNDFARFKNIALEKGFKRCQSGPLVRSSYHADELLGAN